LEELAPPPQEAPEAEEENFDSEDEDDLSNFIEDYHKTERRATKAVDAQLGEAADIFGDIDMDEDYMEEEEQRPAPSKKEAMKDWIDPSLLEDKYLRPEDEVIKTRDIPERLQVTFFSLLFLLSLSLFFFFWKLTIEKYLLLYFFSFANFSSFSSSSAESPSKWSETK
jgi:hypothetical protein